MVELYGTLLHDCRMLEVAPHATGAKIVEQLWTLSEKLEAQEFKF